MTIFAGLMREKEYIFCYLACDSHMRDIWQVVESELPALLEKISCIIGREQ